MSVQQASAITPVAARYTIEMPIGSGGMGTVYRATDRLNGQQVALKRVTVSADKLEFATRLTADSTDYRLALAKEFRTLASLRHPNIISVLDYGFDADRQPFFTMELVVSRQNIIESGKGKPIGEQVELIVQVLRAISYLHRRGVIHRDLKPDNVLVLGGEVKLLDFGLAVARSHIEDRSGSLSGTLAYMAPELLRGGLATEASDLYSVGVMAYELFAGEHPFQPEGKTASALMSEIVLRMPDVHRLGLDARLEAILLRLLAKDPANRFESAAEIIEAYAHATGRADLERETASIRESFLQAATFVGRQAEIDQLTASLDSATDGRGSTWLIGGESGVGKSRLLEELRTYAMVKGMLVLYGQAVHEGALPYQEWRAPLRRLILESRLETRTASTLKTLIPDIERLVDRPVPDALPLDPKPARQRLNDAVLRLFREAERPVLLVIEDLQWADESLELVGRLARTASDMPLIVMATYRDDERPTLPSDLRVHSGGDSFQVVPLPRLTRSELSDLSRSMLGEAGQTDGILSLLQRETEGNVFFVVETVRALAEEAGRLDRIADMEIPASVFAGGMRQIVERRLARAPEATRGLLETAAVIGREVDERLLRGILQRGTKKFDGRLEDWLTLCSSAAVLDLKEDRWRFTHDKLREQLLANLDESSSRALHRAVAETIEAVYPDESETYARLAHHWQMAGDALKERDYSVRAGEYALRTTAQHDAIRLLERARELYGDTHELACEKGIVLRRLADAYVSISDFTNGRPLGLEAVRLLGYPMSVSTLGQIGLLIGQIAVQIAHRMFPPRGHMDEARLSAVLAYERLAEIYYFQNQIIPTLCCAFRAINIGETLGQDTSELARAYSNFGFAMGLSAMHPLARYYLQRGDAIVRPMDNPDALSWTSLVWAAYLIGVAEWKDFERINEESILLAQETNNIRRWAEMIVGAVFYRQYRGRFRESAILSDELIDKGKQLDDPQTLAWGYGARAYSETLLGKGSMADQIAEMDYEELTAPDLAMRAYIYGTLGLHFLRQGHMWRALEFAGKGLDQVKFWLPTGHYSYEGYAGITAVFLANYERAVQKGEPTAEPRKLAQRAINAMRIHTLVFNTSQPRMAISQGTYAAIGGNLTAARRHFERAIRLATEREMPYEEALARFELGARLPRGNPDRRANLENAVRLFQQCETIYDLELAQEALASS